MDLQCVFLYAIKRYLLYPDGFYRDVTGGGSKATFLILALSLLSMSYVGAQDTSHGRNYDEEKVRPYTIPDPLLRADGSRVKDAEDWENRRRADVLRDFRGLMYGHTPDMAVRMQPTIIARKSDAVNGLATRTIVDLKLFDDQDAPRIQLMLYLPKNTEGPVPVFLGLSFYGNAGVEKDSLIPLTKGWMRPHSSNAVIDNRATDALRGLAESRWPLALILQRGYGVATFYYGDMEPDHIGGWRDGIRGYALNLTGKPKRRPDDWGALGAWSWGLSRALDYLETLPEVDAKRVVVFGHSRLGKTALWAGAQDKRFAIVISNNSGEGGASLARRNFGENIAYSIAHASWRYCDRFQEYINREGELPFDQHMLLGLIAPRPVYIASATEDLLADPKGEFITAAHAEPIYQLFGKRGVGTMDWPPPDTPIGYSVGYHLRTGKHDITTFDWECFLDFADRHFADRHFQRR